MKKFYLLRHEDVSGYSGTGVVAEGVIFDDGTGAFTWLSEEKTVTVFLKLKDIKKLHEKNGKSEIIIEGKKKFEACQQAAQDKKIQHKTKKRINEENG